MVSTDVVQDRRRVLFFGGIGALLNCAFTLHSLSFSLDGILQDLFHQPFHAARTVLLFPAVIGFFLGGLLLVLWSYLRVFVIRALLQYNGWLLRPRNPFNKVWYLLLTLLLGKRNLGGGNYQIFLPSLPVPALKETCVKYLRSVKPLLSEEEYKRTEQIVNDFQRKEGKKLQECLVWRSWTNRNWISDWWDEYIYLRQRTPIPLSSNYFSLGTRRPTTPHQLDRAAMLYHVGAKFAMEYDAGHISNMMAMDLIPFCMHPMTFTCSSSRIPGREVDTYQSIKFNSVTHSIVIRQGKFYTIELSTKDRRVFPPSLIKKQLEKVVEMAGDKVDDTGIMSFTALPREDWAAIRERLVRDPVNKDTLDAISNGFNLISLETESPPIDDLTARGRDIFHGNLHNRWFDKCVLVPVYPNGLTASNAEHSHLDATICAQIWEYMLQNEKYDEDGHVVDDGFNMEDYPQDVQPKELKWNVEGLQDELAKAKENLTNMIADSDMYIFSPSYGKNIPKKCRLSPDGWFQLALQLTYYRMYHKLVLTYESATTRLYYKGRTETIRPVSMQSKAFVEAMDDPNVTVERKKELLKDAIKYQEQYKFQAMRGKGVDRHLFGLYIVAKWLKMDPMPEIFTDKAFQMTFQLSTSQTPSQIIKDNYRLDRANCVGGFGTITDDGYGVSYMTYGEDTVNFSIHCKKSCPTTSARKFGEGLNKVFEDLKELYSDVLREK